MAGESYFAKMVAATLVVLAVYFSAEVTTAPTGTKYVDLAFSLDLFNPCPGSDPDNSGSGSTTENTQINVTIPDMEGIVEDARRAVENLTNVLTSRRLPDNFDGQQFVDCLWQNITQFNVSDIPSTTQQRIEALEEVWANLILYISYLRKSRVYEYIWSLNKEREITFEQTLTRLEKQEMSNLLCSVKIYSEANGVSLRSGLSDKVEEIANLGSVNHTEGDISLYVVLSGFQMNFVPYAKEMYKITTQP